MSGHHNGIIFDGMGYCHGYPHMNFTMNLMISPSKMVDAVGFLFDFHP
jgi:hypothetical protein